MNNKAALEILDGIAAEAIAEFEAVAREEATLAVRKAAALETLNVVTEMKSKLGL